MEILDINNLPELTKYSHLFRASYDDMFKISMMTNMSSIVSQIILNVALDTKTPYANIGKKLDKTLVDIVINISKSLSIVNAFISFDRIRLFNEIIKKYDQPEILLVTSRLKIINLYLTENIKNKFSAILTPLLYKKDTWSYRKNYEILKSSNKVISLIGDYETSHIELLNQETTKFYNNELGAYEYVFCPTIFYNQTYALGQLIYPAFVYILTNITIGMLNLKSGGTLVFELKATPIFPALDQLFYILESSFTSIEYEDFETSILVKCNKFNRQLFSTKYAALLIQACVDSQEYQIDNLYELDDIDIIYSKNIKPKRRFKVVHKLFDNKWKAKTVFILEKKFKEYFTKLNILANQLLPIQDVMLYQYLNTFLLKNIIEIIDFMTKNNFVISKYYYTLLFNYHNDIFAELYKSNEPININLEFTNDESHHQQLSNTPGQYNLSYLESITNNLNNTIALVPNDINIKDLFDNIRIKNIINKPEYKSLYSNTNPEFYELLILIYKYKSTSAILHIGEHSNDILNILINNTNFDQLKWKVIDSVANLKSESNNGGFKWFYKYPDNFITNYPINDHLKYKDCISKISSFNQAAALITNFTSRPEHPVYDWFYLGIIMNIATKNITDCIIQVQFTQTNNQHLIKLITGYKSCFTTIHLVLPTTTDTTKNIFYILCKKYKGNESLLKKINGYIDEYDKTKKPHNSHNSHKSINFKSNPCLISQFHIFFDKLLERTIKTVDYKQYILDCLLDKKNSYIRKKTYCSELIKPFLELRQFSKTRKSGVKSINKSTKKISGAPIHKNINRSVYKSIDEANNIYNNYLDNQYSRIRFNPKLQNELINNLLHMNTKSSKYETSLCIINVILTAGEINIYIANEGDIPNDSRKDSIKEFINGLLQYYKSLEIRPIISTCILIWISDHGIWNKYHSQDYDMLLPICTYACQQDERYLLIPDSQFVNLSVHNRYHDGFINWDNQIPFFYDQPEEKNKMIFFRGADTTRDNHNLRMALYNKIEQDPGFKQNMIYEILTKQNYEPPWNFLNYRFLLNLPGQYPWSTRQKYNYLSQAFIINVRVATQGDTQDKYYNSFIDIFVPDELCHNIDMKFYYYNPNIKNDPARKAKYNLLNKLQINFVYDQIKKIYNQYKNVNPLKNSKVKEAYRRAKLITNSNIIYYFTQIIERNNTIGLKPID